ncbi:HTH myb-type domain-containing protein [Mycena indigotica]|uniref:HTH myb-type domain-containing protein n=1 Tax=Mycena indigotica TaxID=2126181 RepID=A0A8H6SXD0_9AGAR|nr:HTH myb-type domain-containing protein [Mycena indigotica]KAF7307099.1 HTH myb-type domain-containing protein [Mycena indigotica]
MTSRVQKGGPVFKPVIKARARATSSVPRATPAPPIERESVVPVDDGAEPNVPGPSTSSLPLPPTLLNPTPESPPALIVPPATPPSIIRAPTILSPSPPRPKPPSVATASSQIPPSSNTLVGSSTQASLPSSLPPEGESSQDPTQVDPPPSNDVEEAASPAKKKAGKRKRKDGDGGDTEADKSASPTKKARKKKGVDGETTEAEPSTTKKTKTPKKSKKKKGVDGEMTEAETSTTKKSKKKKAVDGETTEAESSTTKKPRKKKAVDGETTEAETSKSPTKKKTIKRKKKGADGETTEGETTSAEKPQTRKKKTQIKEEESSSPEIPRKRKKKATEDGQSVPKAKRPKKQAAAETGTDDDTPGEPKRRVLRKRKVVEVQPTESEIDELESDSPPSLPKIRRKRKPKLPPFDPDADPGEELDPTAITMAELCEDNGQGRVSSKAMEIQRNHFAWKQQSKDKRARMKMLAERKKYGQPEDADDEETAPAPTVTPAAPVEVNQPEENAVADPSEPIIVDESGSGFDYSKDLTTSRFHVQVRIGPNGETIIDEDSLAVDRTEEVDTTNYVHVVESDNTKFVNSASYTKKCRGSRWSAEETELFFEALAQHGENYELISLVLPGRSRTACKNKFKAEDKKDSARINRCLESKTPIDMDTLARLTGRDFSGPTPIIKMPSPPPVPEKGVAEPPMEPETPGTVRKRSRSRSRRLSASDGVEIIGDAASYVDND